MVVEICERHGEWIDDGTTDVCPECLADSLAAYFARLRAATPKPVVEEEK